jgi:hypothetical protein
LQNWQTFFFGLRRTGLAIVVLPSVKPGSRRNGQWVDQ